MTTSTQKSNNNSNNSSSAMRVITTAPERPQTETPILDGLTSEMPVVGSDVQSRSSDAQSRSSDAPRNSDVQRRNGLARKAETGRIVKPEAPITSRLSELDAEVVRLQQLVDVVEFEAFAAVLAPADKKADDDDSAPKDDEACSDVNARIGAILAAVRTANRHLATSINRSEVR